MRYRLVLTGIALAACAGSNAPEVSNPEPRELAGMTMFHNKVRAMVDTTGVAGGPLPPLTWDPMLAATAAAWVKQCKSTNGILLDHNPDRSAGYPWPVGENIYEDSITASAFEAVLNPGHGWASEAMFYHYDTNTCDPNETCGHYTQLVWRTTEKVGCALGLCINAVFPSMIVCDYGPAGNIDGEKPY